MNILIAENEKHAAEKLIRLLQKIDPTIRISGITETVEGSVNWIQSNNKPDLILMDIQLDDGLCFEIFETINVETPVIFTTAFDEYTLRAFKVNSVDYLLKPVEEEALRAAIEKFRKYHSGRSPGAADYGKMFREFSARHKSRFLVRAGSRYRSIPASEISHFHILDRSVFLKDFSGKDYGMDHSLDQLQHMLDPEKFFRISRDCIVNIDAITLISRYSSSRLIISLKPEEKSERFIVSRDKAAEFKRWADG